MKDEGKADVQLSEVVRAALGPFEGQNLRCALNAEAAVASEAVVPLTLALNELATNAIKYGALSSTGGSAEITSEVNAGRVTLTWRETGGARAQAPQHQGFGSRLIDAVASRLPGGRVSKEFTPEGLLVVLDFENGSGGA
ncbi:two-component sensor histidine kinase [Bradyrhizobium sp. USDA 326]